MLVVDTRGLGEDKRRKSPSCDGVKNNGNKSYKVEIQVIDCIGVVSVTDEGRGEWVGIYIIGDGL